MLRVSIRKRLPEFVLEVEFTWGSGVLVVSGASGAGKTTLLDCLAGLRRPDQGRIDLAGRVLFDSAGGVDVPPQKRRIGYVFQDHALFPHLSVKQNVMYGVGGCCKCREPRYRLSVREVMDGLKISHLQDRYPAQLSGGERQRVSLARALMTEPDLLLLDEPWCSLDDETRAAVRQEVVELQRVWQIPFILVTHDGVEAELLGDAILHLDRGVQVGFRARGADGRHRPLTATTPDATPGCGVGDRCRT